MSKKNKNIYIIVITIILGAFGIIYYNFSKEKTPINIKPAQIINSSQTQASCNEEIVYLKETNNNKEIIFKNCSDEKLLFTDKDEENKIISAQTINQNNQLLALTKSSKETYQSLYLLSLKGDGSKELVKDNFASSTTPKINKSSTKIAYTNFSNAELDYGYSLLIYDIQTKQTTRIGTYSNLTDYYFSPDKNQLIAVTDKGLLLKNLDTNDKPEEILESKNITLVLWNTENIFFTEQNDQKTIIYKINPQTKEKVQLKSFDKQISSICVNNEDIFYNSNGKLYKNETEIVNSDSQNIIKCSL